MEIGIFLQSGWMALQHCILHPTRFLEVVHQICYKWLISLGKETLGRKTARFNGLKYNGHCTGWTRLKFIALTKQPQ
ncbi:hypothetical protein Hdeb2414_s1039g00975871 [Helianthus debilis subsp. tardiflorus]